MSMLHKKILVIAYYWPPDGGAGVQRWLKLTKYLVQEGWQPTVITVKADQASYMQRDETLLSDVAEGVRVIRTDSFEPINWYARLVGKKNVPSGGFANVSNSWKQRLVNSLRSHLFIPDPRRGWVRFAAKAALDLLAREPFDAVITTSPPPSVQLTGLRLKGKTAVPWISDMRDPWTDIYYYPILGHSVFSHAINLRLERKALTGADALVSVSEGFLASFIKKYPSIGQKPTAVIKNGFDPEDFEGKTGHFPETFTLTYTGTIGDTYRPEVFFDALRLLLDRRPEANIRFRVAGKLSPTQEAYAREKGLGHLLELPGYVPHDESVNLLLSSSALVLIIMYGESETGILPGKIYEYLASRKPVLCIGPPEGDAARMLRDAGAGATFDRSDAAPIADYLETLYDQHLAGTLPLTPAENVLAYSRREQARAWIRLISSLPQSGS